MEIPLRELIDAAESMCAANCTRHRDRARLRLRRAIEGINGESKGGNSPAREVLLVDLARFVIDLDDDPVAFALAQRAFNHGVVGR